MCINTIFIVKDVIYTEQYGDRADVPDLAIVMTDGKAQEGNLVIEASQRVHDVYY